jgi:DNA processing protein
MMSGTTAVPGAAGTLPSATDCADQPAEAYAAALAGLPGMGPARLSAILACRTPAEAWSHVCSGRPWTDPGVVQALGPRAGDLLTRWRMAASEIDLAAVWHALASTGVGIVLAGTAGYPQPLAGDIEPPAILFHQGPLAVITGPRVAIVGTRRCSSTGAGVAFELGRELAATGVTVISGLAAGVDGAAHRGVLAAGAAAGDTTYGPTATADARGGVPPPRAVASGPADMRNDRATHRGVLPFGPVAPAAADDHTAGARAAPPIGVVGSGLDVVYPTRHRDLWAAVGRCGLLLSEAPLGARPERWRFPARNRIIAALAHLVVVVESHRRGGSLHTVDEADRRGVDVMAVPGSLRNPAAAGTNELLAEGRAPVCSVDDVLVALGLGAGTTGATAAGDRRPRPDHADESVLEAVGWQPATLDDLVLRTGLGLARLAPALDRLADGGWVARRGGWYERIALPGSQEEP